VPAGFPDRLAARLYDTIVSHAVADERIAGAWPGTAAAAFAWGFGPVTGAPSCCRT